MPDQHSYAGAGVDIDAGERAVDLMRAAVQRTARAEVIGGIGGFAGLFDVSAAFHQGFAASGESRAGPVTQLFYLLRRYIGFSFCRSHNCTHSSFMKSVWNNPRHELDGIHQKPAQAALS